VKKDNRKTPRIPDTILANIEIIKAFQYFILKRSIIKKLSIIMTAASIPNKKKGCFTISKTRLANGL